MVETTRARRWARALSPLEPHRSRREWLADSVVFAVSLWSWYYYAFLIHPSFVAGVSAWFWPLDIAPVRQRSRGQIPSHQRQRQARRTDARTNRVAHHEQRGQAQGMFHLDALLAGWAGVFP